MNIHASHHGELRRAVLIISALLLVITAALTMPVNYGFAAGLAGYVPLHITLEMASITVAFMIFAIGRSVPRKHSHAHVFWLSSVFLAVAMLDTLHMLSYQGMPDLITQADPQKAINFWLSARYLAAAGLLLSALSHWLPSLHISREVMLSLAMGYVVVSLIWFLGYPETVPVTFSAEHGLSDLKILLEYLLMVLYLITAVLIVLSMRRARSFNAAGLFAAAVIMAMSEFLFTLYADVADLYNLLGHIYKVIAYWFLYRALYVETVQMPYQQLQASERLLRQRQEELDYFFDANLDLFCIGDSAGRFVRVNSAWEKVMGYRSDELEGRALSEFVADDQRDAARRWIETVAISGQLTVFRVRVRCADGSHRHLEWRAVSRQGVVYASARDVTAQLHQEAQIRLLSSVVDQNPYPVIITDLKGHIEYVNAAFTQLSGYDADEVVGRDPGLLKSGRTDPAVYRQMWNNLREGKAWEGELINRNKHGREYTEHTMIYPLRDEQGQVISYISHKEDITARREAERRIEQLSHYDQLTGLPNRDLLRSRFTQGLERVTRHNEPFTLLWLDIDHFKAINDTLGHNMGDLVLREMAMRMRGLITAQDTLGRHSGDGFVLLLPGADDNKASALAEQLLQQVQQPLMLLENAQELSVTASIGIAMFPNDGDDFDALMACAEVAMYRAKQEGRNNFRFYAPEMQASSLRKLALSSSLTQALSRGELWLAYQPQFDLQQQQMTGAEVLLRWRSPQWGDVSPAEFIPLAESNGMIISIDDWVLQQAARQLQQWQQQGLPPIRLAINLSALQFVQPDLAANAAALVRAEGLEPGAFELELTEAVALNNPEDAQQIMADLRRTGFHLSIDDFGTGYSSMSYLKRFAVDKLKIDQSFIRELNDSDADQGIVTALIQLAHSLNMGVVAEGVEERQQLEFLARHGCDSVQGYYFSRPLAAADFEVFWQHYPTLSAAGDLPAPDA